MTREDAVRLELARFVRSIDSLLEHETPGPATERRHTKRKNATRPRSNVAYEMTRAARKSPPREYAAMLRAKRPKYLQPHLAEVLAFLKKKRGQAFTDETIAETIGRTIGAVHTSLWRLRKLGLVKMLPA